MSDYRIGQKLNVIVESIDRTGKAKFRVLHESKQDHDNFKNWIAKELKVDVDSDKVEDIFNKFVSAKKSNKFSSPEMKDWYYWIKNKSIKELNNALKEIDDNPTRSKLRKEGYKRIYEKDGWRGYKVTSFEGLRGLMAETELGTIMNM